MGLLNKPESELNDAMKVALDKHKRDLFGYGHDLVEYVSQDYIEFEVIQKFGFTSIQWEELPLETRAKYIAYQVTSNMIETIKRDIEIKERNREEEQRKLNAKQN